MIEWTTATSLIRAGKAGYENRHAIQKYWTILKKWLDAGGTQVAVTGHSGAGKSMLTAQLHGSARELYFEAPGESDTVEVEAISIGEWTKLFRVLPGQKGRRTGGEIDAFQNNAALEGVIHLVDFGYVAPRDRTYADTLIHEDGIDTVAKLRARNINLELDDLKALIENLRRSLHQTTTPKWLLIAVNKTDLYLADRRTALMHYHPEGNSGFSKLLCDFQREVGEKNLGIYVVEVCAHAVHFEWNDTAILSSLGPQQQKEILQQFATTLAKITAKHT